MLLRTISTALAAGVLALGLGATAPVIAAGEHAGGHGNANGHADGDRGAHGGTAGRHGGGDKGHEGGHHGRDIGKPGKPEAATRTVRVEMHDNYYEPEAVTAKRGETIRFEVVNTGSLVHEFNIGTAAMHRAHGREMKKMMEAGVLEPDHINESMMNAEGGHHGMKHDDPNSVLLEPGESATVTWTFNTRADLQFACNVPGHYASGMHGDIRLN